MVRRWLYGAMVLLAPTIVLAQEDLLPVVDSTVQTTNNELGAMAKRFGVPISPEREMIMAHIQPRQAFYRMQRVARRVSQLGENYGVKRITLPARPKGDIPAGMLQDMANDVLESVRSINKSLGVGKQPNVGTVPGQYAPEIFNSLGMSIEWLNLINAATENQGRPGGRVAAPEPSEKPQRPNPRERNR